MYRITEMGDTVAIMTKGICARLLTIRNRKELHPPQHTEHARAAHAIGW
jgi:hypothetical protein